MAKLSARGRTELLRLERYENETDPLSDTGEIRPLVRRELALMSDRVVLSKATFTRPDGSTHSAGWSVLGKLKDGQTVETFREAYTTREPKYTVKR